MRIIIIFLKCVVVIIFFCWSCSVIMESEESNSTQKSKFSKIQWLCIILAWLITALGVGIYIYVLFAAFSGNHKILSKASTLVLITVLSNICLLSAVYFHKKIRKYLLWRSWKYLMCKLYTMYYICIKMLCNVYLFLCG